MLPPTPKFPTRRPWVSQGSAVIQAMEAASAVQLKLDDLLMILRGLQGPCFSPRLWATALTALQRLNCSQQNRVCPDPILEFGGQPSLSEQQESRLSKRCWVLLKHIARFTCSKARKGQLPGKCSASHKHRRCSSRQSSLEVWALIPSESGPQTGREPKFCC